MTHSRTLNEFARQIGVLSKSDYEKLKAVADDARQHAIEAQTNLHAHIAEHGCDSKREAAA